MGKHPRKIVLKDHTEILVRPMAEGDYEQIRQFFQGIDERDRLFLKEDVTDNTIIRRWFRRMNYDSVYPLLAFSENQLVGVSTLHRTAENWSHHVGEIRVVIADSMRKKGIAAILISSLVEHAPTMSITKIIGYLAEEQVAARKLLITAGFREVGTLKEHVKTLHGERKNMIIMCHDVVELWRKMEDLVHRLTLRMEY